MELTAEQKDKVTAWIEEGAKLAEVQQRLAEQFDLHLTYMDARFLMDDLKLAIKEPPAPEPVIAAEQEPAPAKTEGPATEEKVPEITEPPAGTGRVSVKVDTITRPGALVSGTVTFGDGKDSAWYLDQTGRLGMVPNEPGYRPPEPDIMEFQTLLEQELAKLGM